LIIILILFLIYRYSKDVYEKYFYVDADKIFIQNSEKEGGWAYFFVILSGFTIHIQDFP